MKNRIGASFRDPSGTVFKQDGTLYRTVAHSYRPDYDFFMESGLYSALTDRDWLVTHEEVSLETIKSVYKVIRPRLIPFISYPYEWSFSQLKDAALLTLSIQKLALEYGLSLKDASAYNIQFINSKPVFIDTLSFERYTEGEPWVAYRQFCKHFIAPLALMSYRDVRLKDLLLVHLAGIPIDLTSSLLPLKTHLRLGLLTHIHLHAKSEKTFADKTIDTQRRRMGRLQLKGLVDSLQTCVERLKWTPADTEWADYYTDTNYSQTAIDHKQQVVQDAVNAIDPDTVWDLGANNGRFSRIASRPDRLVCSFDIDPAAVEQNYLNAKRDDADILPLCLDLTQPSPAIGWNNRERMALLERSPVDLVMALALIHHLAISNNVPLSVLAEFFAEFARHLIIEFVPKEDSQVQRLLKTREDIFDQYTQDQFETDFKKRFHIQTKTEIRETLRTVYLLSNKRTF
jgi:hypothetical protein